MHGGNPVAQPFPLKWNEIDFKVQEVEKANGTKSKTLFSPFNITCLVTQESVVLFKCCILHNIAFWSQMSYYRGFSKKMGYFNVKCHFVYTMIILKDEITCLWEKYAHHVTRYGVLKKNKNLVPWWCLHRITHYKSKSFLSLDGLVGVGGWHLVQFIHKRLHVHHI